MSLRLSRASVALAATIAAAGCGAPIPHLASGANAAALPLQARPATALPGARFRYSGSLIQSGDGVSSTTHVAQTVTVTATPDPLGSAPGALDYAGVETDRTGTSVATWREDAWQGNGSATGGSVPFLLYGERVGDGAGDASTSLYPTPRTVDRSPQRNGEAWSNGAALVYTENDADGTTARATYAAAGSYTERVRYASPCGYSAACTLAIAVGASGAARYTGSLLAASGIASISFGAPANGWIEIAYTYAGGSQQRATIPAWYAAGAALYRENDAIATGVAFPRRCGVLPAFGSIGNAVVRTISQTDPAAGTLLLETDRSYSTPAYGTVCATVDRRLTSYYDLATGSYGATPLANAVTAETLTLQSASLQARRAFGVRLRLALATQRLGQVRSLRDRGWGRLGRN